VQDGDIICVACGTNLLTGQKIANGAAPAPVVHTERNRLPLYVIGVLVGAIILLALIFGAVYFLTSNPVQKAAELAASGKEIEAASVLAKHLEKHSDDARALELMGKLDWKRGRFAEASASLTKASDIAREDPDLAMMAVLSLAAQDSVATRGQRIDILKRVADDFPDGAAAYLLALEQGAADDVDGEISSLKKVVEKTPTDANASLALGVASAMKGDIDAASGALAIARQQPANAGDASAALGFANGKAGKLDEAVEAFRAAASGDASVKNLALTRLGVLLVSQGKVEEAQPFLSEAVAANKDDALAQFFHGVCLESRGLTPEAINAFESVAAKRNSLTNEALVRLGELQLAQGNQDKAMQYAQQAETAGVTGPALSTILGRIHAALGEEDKAAEYFEKAIKSDSAYAPAHLENGLLLVRREEVSEGVRELEQYLELIEPSQQGTKSEEVKTMVEHLKKTAGKPSAKEGSV
jgi:tetratricopeptide (TPR) repeat protein